MPKTTLTHFYLSRSLKLQWSSLPLAQDTSGSSLLEQILGINRIIKIIMITMIFMITMIVIITKTHNDHHDHNYWLPSLLCTQMILINFLTLMIQMICSSNDYILMICWNNNDHEVSWEQAHSNQCNPYNLPWMIMMKQT